MVVSGSVCTEKRMEGGLLLTKDWRLDMAVFEE